MKCDLAQALLLFNHNRHLFDTYFRMDNLLQDEMQAIF